jgi:hypothetical protein
MVTIEQVIECGLRRDEAHGLVEWFGGCLALVDGERSRMWSNFGRRFVRLNLRGKDLAPPPCNDGWAAPYAAKILDCGQTDPQTVSLRKLFAAAMGQTRVCD